MAVGVMDARVTEALSIGIHKLNTCAPTFDTSAGNPNLTLILTLITLTLALT